MYPTLPDAPPPPPKCLHNGNPATSGLIDMDTFVAVSDLFVDGNDCIYLHSLQIRDELPKNLQHCNFEALYTATQHGYSLKTFEHHVSNKGAFVIIVKDSEGHVNFLQFNSNYSLLNSEIWSSINSTSSCRCWSW